MLPAEFREQLQMSLHIYLRPSEGAAVARFFDVEQVGSINGEVFVRWFLQAGLDSREVRCATMHKNQTCAEKTHTNKDLDSRCACGLD